LDLPNIVETFKDHHTSKGSTFKDWHAALNTWLRREQPTLMGGMQRPPVARPTVAVNQCDGTQCLPGRHEWTDGRNRFVCMGDNAA
jgi:hypothetical protein